VARSRAMTIRLFPIPRDLRPASVSVAVVRFWLDDEDDAASALACSAYTMKKWAKGRQARRWCGPELELIGALFMQGRSAVGNQATLHAMLIAGNKEMRCMLC
jgi:hypothetical protein